jgi:hypothetical protein
MARYSTKITMSTADSIEAIAWNAAISEAQHDALAIRLRWSVRAGFGTPADLDGCIADYAQRGYVAAAKRAINAVRDSELSPTA